MCGPSCLKTAVGRYGHHRRHSYLQHEKEERGLVPRNRRNGNAGARGYMVSSLPFSPASHVAGVNHPERQRQSPPEAGNKAVRV